MESEDRTIEHKRVRRSVKQSLSRLAHDSGDESVLDNIWDDSAHADLTKVGRKMDIVGYGKIYNIGHKAILDLFNERVVVQEKVDGSQFSFGMFDGKLVMRSKKKEVFYPSDDGLFAMAIDTANRLFEDGLLVEGYSYRAEAITKPKHNTLVYDRIPFGGVMLYDIDRGYMDYMDPEEMDRVAVTFGLETVKTLFDGMVTDLDQLKGFLELPSALGGQIVEGIVIKNYTRFGVDGKTLMGKWVREDFKERNGVDFRGRNKSGKDIVAEIIEIFRNENRWLKSIHHLRDEGGLTESPKDIGPLIKEIQQDIFDECEDEIRDMLFNHFWKKAISRGVVAGFPEWYKDELAKSQTFGEVDDS